MLVLLSRALSPPPPTPWLGRSGLLTSCAGAGPSSLSPPLLAEAQAFFAARGLSLRCDYVAPAGTRTMSRIAVRAASDNGQRAGSGALIGMFKPGTHDVVPCSDDERCHIAHHPAINEAIATVLREIEAFGELEAYDEVARRGTLRYLQLSVERPSRRVQVVLVANAHRLEDAPSLGRFASRLWAGRHGVPRLHSVWANLNPTLTNNILSYGDGAWQLLHCDAAEAATQAAEEAEEAATGPAEAAATAIHLPGSVQERYPSGAAFVLPPFVFRQANLDGFDGIVAQLRAAVPAGARVVEWYAGVGSLGLSVAPEAEWVRAAHGSPLTRPLLARHWLPMIAIDSNACH